MDLYQARLQEQKKQSLYLNMPRIKKIKVDNSTYDVGETLSEQIEGLSDGPDNFTDNTVLVTSNASGNTTYKTWYKRSALKLWNWIKGKTDGLYLSKNGIAKASERVICANTVQTVVLDPIDYHIPFVGANRFFGTPAEDILIEYSRDGGVTWQNYEMSDNAKRSLFSTSTALYLGADNTTYKDKSNYMTRVTYTTNHLYSSINKYILNITTSGSTGSYVTIEEKSRPNYDAGIDEWVIVKDRIKIEGWSGLNSINFPERKIGGTYYSQQIRFTFGVNSHPETLATPGLCIYSIYAYGSTAWICPSSVAQRGFPFYTAFDSRVEFDNIVKIRTLLGLVSSGIANTNSIGYSTIANTEYQTVIGKFNKATTSLFAIGNGTSSSARSNCFEVGANGKVTTNGSIDAIGSVLLQDSRTLDSADSYTIRKKQYLVSRSSYNACNEIVIKTKIAKNSSMNTIHISGYNYNNKDVIDIIIGFYAYTQAYAFSPCCIYNSPKLKDVKFYLSTYNENGTDYFAISIKHMTSTFWSYCMNIDWLNFRINSNKADWTIETNNTNNTNESIIPQTDLTLISQYNSVYSYNGVISGNLEGNVTFVQGDKKYQLNMQALINAGLVNEVN